MGGVFSIRIDDQLAKKLDSIAQSKNISKSALVRKGIELFLKQEDVLSTETIERVNEALRNNKHVPFQADWKQIEKEISQSSPQWDTLSEAMSHSRKREWKE